MIENNGKLNGKIALITGASKNIGRSIAKNLAINGAVVIIHYNKNKVAAYETVNQIKALGGTAFLVQGDVTQVLNIKRMLSDIGSRIGEIDILVNNIGIRPRSTIEEITEFEWDNVINTNLRAPFFFIKYCIPPMKEKKWGRIINISGIDAHWGKANRAHSVSSKAGLIGLTRASALELARFGITVNAIVPGVIDTERVSSWYPEQERLYKEAVDRIPLGRLGKVEEIASSCLFLASTDSSYITGQTINVTGGAFPLVRLPYDEEVE